MAGRSLMARGRQDAGADLVERVKGLTEALELCEGRVDDELVGEARRVVDQADRRLTISGSATVVALAGATGSGKSSIFNAVSGTDLATVGVRRPTTSTALACTWGQDSAEELLDWLQIPRRHAVEGDPARAAALDGLVLLDLPDHDSTEVAHRLEVDRLVQLVDMLVWVVDPQKYADAALHDRYLKPLAQHAGVMMIILNQIDTLTPAECDQCLKDLRRLLASEGLDRVEVVGVSARTGEGMAELRSKLATQVAGKQAAARRLGADVSRAARTLRQASGATVVNTVGRPEVDKLNAEMAMAAGVPVVIEAVGDAWRLRGGLATGWPVLAWMAKFKPDPLRRLHLDRLGAGRQRREIDPSRVGRTSLPAASRLVGCAEAGGAVRPRCPAGPTRPGGGHHRSRPGPASSLVAGGPGAAVAAGGGAGRRPRLAGGGLRHGLSAAAPAAEGALVGAAGPDGSSRRRRTRGSHRGRPGPDRGRGRGTAADVPCSSGAASLDHEGDRRTGRRARTRRAGPL
jgi:GTP-binding protein EngB required for normal cell division